MRLDSKRGGERKLQLPICKDFSCDLLVTGHSFETLCVLNKPYKLCFTISSSDFLPGMKLMDKLGSSDG